MNDAMNFWRQMVFIRAFEEAVLAMSTSGDIDGSVHLCLGQEGIPVGACAALGDDDKVLATYRGHGWALARGADAKSVLAEICHREGGLNGGRAGSAMLSDPDHGFLGENSIVGAGTSIAVGVALAGIHEGLSRVVLVSIGDGAMNQGSVTEAMVFARAKDLPVIFMCENNGWAEMTPTDLTVRGKGLTARAAAIGLRTRTVDGQSPESVRATVAEERALCLAGAGPSFIECATYRLGGHYNRDIEHYRPVADKDEARSHDPIELLRRALVTSGPMTSEDLDHAFTEQVERVAVLVDQMKTMASPDPATATDHVLAVTEVEVPELTNLTVAEMTYQRAVNLALRHELTERQELLVYGEDVGVAGGTFGVTRGLQREFGNARVFDTPISESAILGSAIGGAMVGLRPVVEIMWSDFLLVALDQLVNQAANVRYVNRGRLSAPITIRMQQGVTPGSCAQHSQSLEALIAHVPGLKIGMPATPQDSYDMTRAAIADPDPTILIESRALYQTSGKVTSGSRVQRAEGARRYGRGRDLCLVTWGAMVHEVLAAQTKLEEEGVDVSVLDLRWLSPLDEVQLVNVVAEASSRALIVHEAVEFGGLGAEVFARLVECLGAGCHVARLATPATRIPAAAALQQAIVPNRHTVVQRAIKMMSASAPI